MRKRLSRLALGVSLSSLAALLLTLPFWGHWILFGRPVDPVLYDYHEMVLYATDLYLWAALGGWVVSRLLSRNRARLQWGPAFLTIPLLLVVIVSAVSSAQAVDPTYAAYTTVRLAFLPVLYLMLINAPLRHGLIVWPLAAGMVIQGAVGVPQFLLGHTLGLEWLGETVAKAASPGVSVVMAGGQRWLRAYGLTPHPNILGGVVMASLLIAAGSYLTLAGRRRIALLGSLAIGLGTLLVTFSRAAWLGLAVGGLILLGLLWWSSKARRPSTQLVKSALAPLAGLGLAVVVIFGAVNWPLIRPRLGLTSEGVEIRSVGERVMLNDAALVLIRARPWLGVGLGDFPVALLRLAPETVSYYSSFTPVHIVLLLATAELGFLGGLLWLALIGSPWVALWLRRKQVRMTPWWAGLSAAIAALTVVSFFDHYPWSFQQGRLILCLVWGLWAREWTINRAGEEVKG